MEYIQNVDYKQEHFPTFQDGFIEFIQLIHEGENPKNLWKFIRRKAFIDVYSSSLSPIKILLDIEEITQKKKSAGEVVRLFTIHNDWCYERIGAEVGVSRQYIHKTLKEQSCKYRWLRELMRFRAKEVKGTAEGGRRQVVGRIAPKKQRFLQKYLEFDFQGSDQK